MLHYGIVFFTGGCIIVDGTTPCYNRTDADMEFLTQLFDLLTSPSGSLVYFMVLVFCTVSALWWSYAQWKSTEFPQAKRTVIGLGLIFAAQVTMFVMGGLAWFHV